MLLSGEGKTKEAPHAPSPESRKCGVCYHMFTPQKGVASECENCGRYFCPEDAGKPLEEGITSQKPLCTICSKAYDADGLDGLKQAKEAAFRTHGS